MFSIINAKTKKRPGSIEQTRRIAEDCAVFPTAVRFAKADATNLHDDEDQKHCASLILSDASHTLSRRIDQFSIRLNGYDV